MSSSNNNKVTFFKSSPWAVKMLSWNRSTLVHIRRNLNKIKRHFELLVLFLDSVAFLFLSSIRLHRLRITSTSQATCQELSRLSTWLKVPIPLAAWTKKVQLAQLRAKVGKPILTPLSSIEISSRRSPRSNMIPTWSCEKSPSASVRQMSLKKSSLTSK